MLRASEVHPKDPIIPLNLACYASATSRFEEAKVRLRQAMELDERIRELALDDEDLKPLWDWIEGLK